VHIKCSSIFKNCVCAVIKIIFGSCFTKKTRCLHCENGKYVFYARKIKSPIVNIVSHSESHMFSQTLYFSCILLLFLRIEPTNSQSLGTYFQAIRRQNHATHGSRHQSISQPSSWPPSNGPVFIGWVDPSIRPAGARPSNKTKSAVPNPRPSPTQSYLTSHPSSSPFPNLRRRPDPGQLRPLYAPTTIFHETPRPPLSAPPRRTTNPSLNHQSYIIACLAPQGPPRPDPLRPDPRRRRNRRRRSRSWMRYQPRRLQISLPHCLALADWIPRALSPPRGGMLCSSCLLMFNSSVMLL
jgi:hypothetical protein